MHNVQFFISHFSSHFLILNTMRIALSVVFIITAYIGYDITIKLHRTGQVHLTAPRILNFLFWINLVCVLFALLAGRPIGRYFDELSLISYLSYFNLLIIACFAMAISQLTSNTLPAKLTSFWYMIALGFSYLAVDELCQIHENIDFSIHQIFHITETGLTDRIDDIIILVYLIISLVMLIKCRKELKPFASIRPIIQITVVYIILMILWDISTNRPDLIALFIKNRYQAYIICNQLGVVEELFKISAQWCLCGVGMYCFSIARNQNNEKKIVLAIAIFMTVTLMTSAIVLLFMTA